MLHEDLAHHAFENERSAIKPEIGLFVVWEASRHLRQDILADLRQRFRILRAREVIWSDGMWFANYQRFYADLGLRGVYHQLNKGKGPLLAIVVEDPAPELEYRETRRGRRLVNTSFFDAKQTYRNWGHRFGVHSTETPAETNRDLAMLLGKEYLDTLEADHSASSTDVVTLKRDTTGAHGWNGLDELFAMLDLAVPYVAIRYDRLVSDDPDLADSPIEIITSEAGTVHSIVSTGPYVPVRSKAGGYRDVSVGNGSISLGIRSPGDHFLDDDWMRALLETRRKDEDGIYGPAEDERFWLLAYHCVVHGRALSAPVRERLRQSAEVAGVSLDTQGFDGEADPAVALDVLAAHLRGRGLTFPAPLDPRVGYAPAGTAPLVYGTSLPLRLQRVARSSFSRARARLKTDVYWMGDHALSVAPWLAHLRRVRSLPRRVGR